MAGLDVQTGDIPDPAIQLISHWLVGPKPTMVSCSDYSIKTAPISAVIFQACSNCRNYFLSHRPMMHMAATRYSGSK